MELTSSGGDGGGALLNAKPIAVLLPCSTSSELPIAEDSLPALSVRYESQKKRDWKTLLKYMENHSPPLTVAGFSDADVIKFLKHLDQFGKTKVHLSGCVYFGHPKPPEPCDCPFKQAWGSLDALIGRLRAAYEENGLDPETNPFGARALRLYLRELRDGQAKSRGLEKRRRKKLTTISTSTSVAGSTHLVDGSRDGCGGGGSTLDASGVVTSVAGITQMVDGGGGVSTFDDGGVDTSMAVITQLVDGSSGGGGGGSTSNSGGVFLSTIGIAHVAGGVFLSTVGITHVVDGCTGGGVGGVFTSDAGGDAVEQTTRHKFITGTPVEVNLRDKQCHDAWFPATVLKKINHDLFLVRYNNLRLSDEEWCSKAIVDMLHIRPSPPENLEGKHVAVSDKVDAYYDCGWWSGEITEVLVGNRYIVQFNKQKTGREFSQFELRCHMEWINGKWVTIHGTAYAAGESNKRKQNIELPTPESNNTKSSPPCKKSKNGEATEGSLFPLAHPEKAMPTTASPSGGFDYPAPNVGHENIGSVLDSDTVRNHQTTNELSMSAHSNIEGQQSDSSKTQVQSSQKTLGHHALDLGQENFESVLDSDTVGNRRTLDVVTVSVVSNNKGQQHDLSKTHALDFGQENIGSVLDSDTVGNYRTLDVVSVSAVSNNEGLQRDLSKTQAQSSQKNVDHPAVDFGQENIGSILDSDTVGNHPTLNVVSVSAISSSKGQQCDLFKIHVQSLQKNLCHPALDFGQENSGSVLDSETAGNPQTLDVVVSVSTLSNGEGQQCDLSQTQVQSSQKSLVQSPPQSIKRPDQQQCKRKGTRWRCHEMASYGNLYCEKHLLERNIHNEKRRKFPRKISHFSLEQFLPSEPQQCRRTGTGWRCDEMASLGERWCEKHLLEAKILNEKRRKTPKECRCLVASGNDERGNSNSDYLLPSDNQHCSGVDIGTKKIIKFPLGEFLPSERQQCRRTGTGWRCPEMTSLGKRYCEKHVLSTKINERNRKPRERRTYKRRKKARKHICLVASGNDERKNFNSDYLLQSDQQHCGGVDIVARKISRFSLEQFLPSESQQCRCTGTGWRCPEMASPGKRYCEKHLLKMKILNEGVCLGQFLPSERQQCRRTGTGWRCPEMASIGKRYCEKHVLKTKINEERRKKPRERRNEKRRKKPREDSCLVASDDDEKRNSDSDYPLPSDHQHCSGGGKRI